MAAEPFIAIKMGPFACFCVNSAGLAVSRDSEVSGFAGVSYPMPETRRLADGPKPQSSPEGEEGMESEAGSPSASSKQGFRSKVMAKLAKRSESAASDSPPITGEVRMHDSAHDASLSTDWINTLLAAFWPRISAAVHKIMDEMVAPMVNEQLRAHHASALANFRFTKFTLGDQAPRVLSVDVSDILTRSQEAGVRLVLPIDLESNVDVQMHAFVATLGAKQVIFRGELVVALVPLINEVPVVGGMVVGFYNAPVIEMDFTGLASIAELKSLDWVVHDVIQTILCSVMVMPNVIAVPLGTKEQGVDEAELNNPPPAWVLRITALRAKNLIGNDYRLFSKRTSDPFLRIKVADQTWCSTVIYRNCDPVWPATESFDFIVYSPKQTVSIEVVDKEHFGRAVLIGKARPLLVMDAVNHKEEDPLPLFGAATKLEAKADVPAPDEQEEGSAGVAGEGEAEDGQKDKPSEPEPDAGNLWIRCERFEISGSGIIGKVSSEKDTRSFLFEVKVGEILWPALLGEAAEIKVTIGGTLVKSTKMGKVRHKKSITSAVQDALFGVATRCKGKGMSTEEIAEVVDMDVKGVTDLMSNRLSHSDDPDDKERAKVEAEKRWEVMKRHTSQTIAIQQVLSMTVSAKTVFKESVVVALLDSSKKEVASQTIKLARLASGSGTASLELPAYETQDKRMATWHGEPRIQAGVQLRMRELVHPEKVPPNTSTASASKETETGHDKIPAEWLNLMVNRLWSRIDKALKKIMQDTVEPLINAQLRELFHLKSFGKVNEFHFARFTLGDVSPLLGPVQVSEFTTKTGLPGVEMVVPVDLKSKVDVQMKAVLASFGAKSIDFTGDLVIRMVPLLDEVPVLGGIVAYFRELPKIDMDFTGLANIVDLVPGFDTLVHGVINNVMLQMLVLPNVISVPIGKEEQGVDRAPLNNPSPIGVLKVTALKARKLVAHDWHLMSKSTSDPFVRCEISASEWKSSTVAGTCDPIWLDDDWHNFMVFDFGQRLKVEVFDAGTLGSVLIGHARPLVVKEIIGSGSKNKVSVQLYTSAVNVDGNLDSAQTAGSVDLQIDWAPIPENLGGGPSTTKHWLLCVKVDEVFMPQQYGTEAGLRVKLGDKQVDSKVGAYKAPKPAQNAVDKALHGVVRRCNTKGMDEKAIMEVTQFTQDHVREAIGDPDKPPHEHPPPLPPVVTIDLERIVYIVMPPQTSDSSKVVELALINSSKAVLATAEVEVAKLSVPILELTRLAMKADDGGSIEAQVTLSATPLEI